VRCTPLLKPLSKCPRPLPPACICALITYSSTSANYKMHINHSLYTASALVHSLCTVNLDYVNKVQVSLCMFHSCLNLSPHGGDLKLHALTNFRERSQWWAPEQAWPFWRRNNNTLPLTWINQSIAYSLH